MAFVGMFLYFKNHANRRLSSEMCKRLERRWKTFNQPLMIVALILNPYERLERFGSESGANTFETNGLIVEVFTQYISGELPPESWTDEEKEKFEEERKRRIAQVSVAYLQYLANTGPFKAWAKVRENWQEMHGDNPIIFWEQYLDDKNVSELAEFAIAILLIVINTAGNERQFSDLKIKKNHLRNRIGLRKLKKLMKIGANLKARQIEDGLKDIRKSCHNYDDDRASQLLTVPRYADLLQNPPGAEDEPATAFNAQRQSRLVRNCSMWRQQVLEWTTQAQEQELADQSDDDSPSLPTRSWLPRSLELLFLEKKTTAEANGTVILESGTRRTRRRVEYNEEILRMELLQLEEEEEMLDDGAKEGSGDEYNDK
ncbi:hypothetical protein D9758_017706 [Tetrapyrgos nigripes]|uniref:HAT C-terminal dimerisation domain-containing protein n=1 Tax=Tetrapyrgos nigripes TaxID=182062 RepID=A0A8H5C7N7_9AGAR|nr:hypothetical protein D9758_017706 [Tetrapyrgos nigripes]